MSKKRELLPPEQVAQKVMGYVHPIVATTIAIFVFVTGYIFGWWICNVPETRYIGLLIAIILVFAVRWPIKAWMSWAANVNEKQISKQIEKEMKASETPDDINWNDFDSASRSILTNTAKTARKQKAKVSVPFLLQELARNIR